MYFQMKSNFFSKTSQIRMIYDDAGLVMKIQLISLIARSFIFTLFFKSFSGKSCSRCQFCLYFYHVSFQIFALLFFKSYFFYMQLRVAKHPIQKTFSNSSALALSWT